MGNTENTGTLHKSWGTSEKECEGCIRYDYITYDYFCDKCNRRVGHLEKY